MFTTEQELVDTFHLESALFLRRLYGKPVSRHFALREFDSQYGIADIVLGTFRPYLSSKWTRNTINENWLAPLFKLSYGAIIQLETYVSQFGVSRKTARRQLQEYIEADFLKPLGANTFQVLHTYKPVVKNVVSIEAKLRDWKQALSQALRYRRFSDYVFVLIDDEFCLPALDNLDLFESSNVGLVSLDDAFDNLHLHHVPELTEKKFDYYFNRLNETAYSYFLKTYATA